MQLLNVHFIMHYEMLAFQSFVVVFTSFCILSSAQLTKEDKDNYQSWYENLGDADDPLEIEKFKESFVNYIANPTGRLISLLKEGEQNEPEIKIPHTKSESMEFIVDFFDRQQALILKMQDYLPRLKEALEIQENNEKAVFSHVLELTDFEKRINFLLEMEGELSVKQFQKQVANLEIPAKDLWEDRAEIKKECEEKNANRDEIGATVCAYRLYGEAAEVFKLMSEYPHLEMEVHSLEEMGERLLEPWNMFSDGKYKFNKMKKPLGEIKFDVDVMRNLVGLYQQLEGMRNNELLEKDPLKKKELAEKIVALEEKIIPQALAEGQETLDNCFIMVILNNVKFQKKLDIVHVDIGKLDVMVQNYVEFNNNAIKKMEELKTWLENLHILAEIKPERDEL